MTRRVGIYSGTFDPVHDGHIAFALAAAQQCQLDEVLFLPESTPRNKAHVSTLAQRSDELQNAIAPYPTFRIVQMQSQQFTIADTLIEITGMTGAADITMLMGSDVAMGLVYWPDIILLLEQTSLAIGIRRCDTEAEVLAPLERLAKESGIMPDITFIHTEHAHLSSSQLRNKP